MARGAVRRVTEGLICLTVLVTVSLVVGLDDRRFILAGPMAATFVSLILKYGGEALRDRRRMINLIGIFAGMAVGLAAMLLNSMKLAFGAPIVAITVWVVLPWFWYDRYDRSWEEPDDGLWQDQDDRLRQDQEDTTKPPR